jgi:hypothetical protein
MYVDRRDSGMLFQQMQQDNRVDAAGKGDGDALLPVFLQKSLCARECLQKSPSSSTENMGSRFRGNDGLPLFQSLPSARRLP